MSTQTISRRYQQSQHEPHAAALPGRFLYSTATSASLGTVGAIAVLSLLAPALVTAAGPWLLVLGVLIGLPHGAVDHLVPGWTGRTAATGRWGMATVVAGYITAAVAAWLVLSSAGPWGLLGLMVLSVVHFGLGDVLVAAERDGFPAPHGIELWCAVYARGGPVLVLPLVFWPQVLDPALDAFDPRVTAILSGPVRVALLAMLVACGAVTLARSRAHGPRLDAAELLALWLVFMVTPPLAAFGVYFGLWHSLRHIVRLLAADPANRADLARSRWRSPLRRYAAAAALPTVGSLVGLAALVALAASTPLLVPMLSLLMALTVPHVVFVAVLDAASRSRSAAARPGGDPAPRATDQARG